jgi:PPOX class probable F420-dependent enzyme
VATLTDEQARLFLEPNIGLVATIRPDGTPQVTPVWVDWDGEHVLFNTAEGRAKPRNIRRDPRVTVAVVSCDDPYDRVSVTGRAEIEEEGAVEHIDKLARKYTGRESFGVREGEKRLIVRVTPERVDPKR